jgi:CheY-like chemotaxis protein
LTALRLFLSAIINGQSQFSSIVIVVLTSSEEPEDLRKAYQLGANSHLVKPPTPAQLIEMAKAFNRNLAAKAQTSGC